jgi:hypothetical protein
LDYRSLAITAIANAITATRPDLQRTTSPSPPGVSASTTPTLREGDDRRSGAEEQASSTLPPQATVERIQVYHKQLYSASYLNLSWSTVLDVKRRLHQLRVDGCDAPLQHVAINFKGKTLGDDTMTLLDAGIGNYNILYFFVIDDGERRDLPL